MSQMVIQRMQKELEILHSVKVRKMAYLGHVMRDQKYQLIQLILQGKIDGVSCIVAEKY